VEAASTATTAVAASETTATSTATASSATATAKAAPTATAKGLATFVCGVVNTNRTSENVRPSHFDGGIGCFRLGKLHVPEPLEVTGFSIGRESNLCNSPAIRKGGPERIFVDIPRQISNKDRSATLWFWGHIAGQNGFGRRVLDGQPTTLKVGTVQFQGSRRRSSVVKVNNGGSRRSSVLLQGQLDGFWPTSALLEVFLDGFFRRPPRQTPDVQLCIAVVVAGFHGLFFGGLLVRIIGLALLGFFDGWLRGGCVVVRIRVRRTATTTAAAVRRFLFDIHFVVFGCFLLVVGVRVTVGRRITVGRRRRSGFRFLGRRFRLFLVFVVIGIAVRRRIIIAGRLLGGFDLFVVVVVVRIAIGITVAIAVFFLGVYLLFVVTVTTAATAAIRIAVGIFVLGGFGLDLRF
jgi:hypothetical protein